MPRHTTSTEEFGRDLVSYYEGQIAKAHDIGYMDERYQALDAIRHKVLGELQESKETSFDELKKKDRICWVGTFSPVVLAPLALSAAIPGNIVGLGAAALFFTGLFSGHYYDSFRRWKVAADRVLPLLLSQVENAMDQTGIKSQGQSSFSKVNSAKDSFNLSTQKLDDIPKPDNKPIPKNQNNNAINP